MTEYFQLKADLNQSNKFKDMMTRLYFEIEESTSRRILFAKLSDSQKMSFDEYFNIEFDKLLGFK